MMRVAGVLLALGVAAAANATPPLQDVSGVITASSKGGATAERTFAGPDGLTGVIVRMKDGSKNVVWLTAHSKVVIPGTIYDPEGNDLTQAAKYEQGILDSPSVALAKAAAPDSRGILVGTKGPILTVFFDPNCTYCHFLYQALRPEVARGRVRVRYVLVGVVKPGSAQRAAAILAASDPAKALAEDEDAFDVNHEEGGYPADLAGPETKRAGMSATVAANNSLMANAGGMGTPTLLFCNAKTGRVELRPGVPDPIKAFIEGMGSGCK